MDTNSLHWTGDLERTRLVNNHLPSAITAVDTQLYEAAEMDGAGRLRKTWHVTLPAIRPVIITLLILKIGQTLD